MQPYQRSRRDYADKSFPYFSHVQRQLGSGQMAAPHLHDMVELLYAKSGVFDLYIDEKPYHFQAGELAVIGALGIHRVEALDAGMHEYLVIQFEPEWVYAQQPLLTLPALSAFMLRNAQKPCVFGREALEASVMPALMTDIHREFAGKEQGYEAAIRADVLRIALWLMRAWNPGEALPFADGALEEASARRLQSALAYIMERYDSPIQLSDIAELCGMSESAFSKFFLKHTRKHFVDYLCDLRIARAEWLLASTLHSVTEIAYEVGFSTASYFIHRFRMANGLTPLQFRKRFEKVDVMRW